MIRGCICQYSIHIINSLCNILNKFTVLLINHILSFLIASQMTVAYQRGSGQMLESTENGGFEDQPNADITDKEGMGGLLHANNHGQRG